MKNTHKLIILLLFTVQSGFGQLFVVNIKNTDAETRRQLTRLIGTLTARQTSQGTMKQQLADAVNNHRKQLQAQYTRNRYDRGNSFVDNAGSLLLGLGTSAVARTPNLPYMTKEKREYLDAVTMNKLLLASLQVINKTNIKSSKRQEIYRLRAKLVREFSKNDREARKLLYFSSAGYLTKNYQDFINMYRVLKPLQISL